MKSDKQRRSERSLAKIWSFLRTGKGDSLCHLVNLNKHGAYISVPRDYNGAPAIVIIETSEGEVSLPFEVVQKEMWAGTDHIRGIGIEFKKPLSEETLALILSDAAEVKAEVGL